MTNPQKRKGDAAEREAALVLCTISGHQCRRQLGAGRQDDVGDIHGIPDTVVQVAAWKDIARAVRIKPVEVDQQKLNAAARYAFTMVKIRGGWRIVMTPEQFEPYLRDASYGV